MNLVHEIDLAVLLAELVLCIHEDEAHLCGNLSSSLEYGLSVGFKLLVVLLAYDALSNDLFL